MKYEFDFSRILESIFGNNSNNKSAARKAKQQRRGRIARLEELEGREMLSVNMLNIGFGDALNTTEQLNDTVIVEVPPAAQTQEAAADQTDQVAAAPVAAPVAAPEIAAAPDTAPALTKAPTVAVEKANTSVNTITLTINKGNGHLATDAPNYEVWGNSGNAATKDNLLVEGEHFEFRKNASGVITGIVITHVNNSADGVKAVKPNMSYTFMIRAVSENGTVVANDGKGKDTSEAKVIKKVGVKTGKYVAVKPKADAKGTVINEEFNKPYTVTNKVSASPYQTTIDSFSIYWASGNRPESETFTSIKLTQVVNKVVTVITLAKIGDTWVQATGAPGNWMAVSGGQIEATEFDAWTGKLDKAQTAITGLQFTGLQANAKYTVELMGCHYTKNAEGGIAVAAVNNDTKPAKVAISTAKYAAVAKPTPTAILKAGADVEAIRFTANLPKGFKDDSALYTQYELFHTVKVGSVTTVTSLGFVTADLNYPPRSNSDPTPNTSKPPVATIEVQLDMIPPTVLTDLENPVSTTKHNFEIKAVSGITTVVENGVAKDVAINSSAIAKVTLTGKALAGNKVAQDGTFVAPPADFKSNKTGMTAALTWTGGTGDVKIQYKEEGGNWVDWEGTPGAGMASITGLEADKDYEFRIKAGGSAWVMDAGEPVVVPGTPAKPTNTNKTDTSVTLTWGAVTGADSYQVQYRSNDGTTWLTAGITYPTATTALVSGLTPDTDYVFQVRGVNTSGNGAWSPSSDVITTDDEAPTVPGKAGKPSGAVVDGNDVDLTWTAAGTGGAPSHYEIRYSNDAGATWATTIVTAEATLEHTITGLAAGTYIFQVRGVNTAGDGDWSESSENVVITATLTATLDDAVKVSVVAGDIVIEIDSSILAEVFGDEETPFDPSFYTISWTGDQSTPETGSMGLADVSVVDNSDGTYTITIEDLPAGVYSFTVACDDGEEIDETLPLTATAEIED